MPLFCRGIQRAALRLEDFGVCGEQVAPFHALRARTGAHQHRRIDIAVKMVAPN
jgi:hypothetical protein